MRGEIENERGFCTDGFFKVRRGLLLSSTVGFAYSSPWSSELEVDRCRGFVGWKGIATDERGEA